VSETIPIKLRKFIEIEFRAQGLILKFDGNNYILVSRLGIFDSDCIQSRKNMRDRVTLLRTWRRYLVPVVVKAVLRAWCSAQVDLNLQSRSSRPINRSINTDRSALCVRLSVFE
jgi:hypothetical protein